jgi:hypothetical protein
MLMTWERNILRIIYGPKYCSGHWRIKINKEMYSNYKSPDIVTIIKICMLEWLGHVVRMDDAKTVKKFLEGKQGGRKKK